MVQRLFIKEKHFIKKLYKKALEKQDAQEVLDILKEDQECMLVVSGDKHAYISKSFADKKEAKKYFQQLLSQTIHNIYLYDFINDDLLYFRKNKGQPTSTTPPFRARLAKA